MWLFGKYICSLDATKQEFKKFKTNYLCQCIKYRLRYMNLREKTSMRKSNIVICRRSPQKCYLQHIHTPAASLKSPKQLTEQRGINN